MHTFAYIFMHSSDSSLWPKMPSKCDNTDCTFHPGGSYIGTAANNSRKCAICKVGEKALITDFTPHEIGGLVNSCGTLKAQGRSSDLEKAFAIFSSIDGFENMLRQRITDNEEKKKKAENSKRKKLEALQKELEDKESAKRGKHETQTVQEGTRSTLSLQTVL